MLRLAVVILVSECLACNSSTSRHPAYANARPDSAIVESVASTPKDLLHTQFLDSEHWFASDLFSLWKTDDGGRSWVASYNALQADNTRQRIRGVSFVSYQIGFLIDRDRLLRTDDAGISWVEIGRISDGPDEYFIDALCFVDAFHGWAAGSALGSSVDNPPYVGAILCTVDGGRTWVRQKVNAPKITSRTGTRWALKDLLFMNEKLGWAVGDYVLCWTDNGCETWQLGAVNSGGFTFVYDRVRFLDELHGWSTARDTKEFFVTDDGGRHWQLRNGPGKFLGPSAEVAFLNSRRGFAINRFLYETEDGGKKWVRLRDDPSSHGAEYSGIDRARDGSLIAFGFKDNVMMTLVSRDAGASWRSNRFDGR